MRNSLKTCCRKNPVDIIQESGVCLDALAGLIGESSELDERFAAGLSLLLMKIRSDLDSAAALINASNAPTASEGF